VNLNCSTLNALNESLPTPLRAATPLGKRGLPSNRMKQQT
jgi:hypothetical protein